MAHMRTIFMNIAIAIIILQIPLLAALVLMYCELRSANEILLRIETMLLNVNNPQVLIS